MTSESVPVLSADYNAERFLRTIHTGSDAGCPTCGLLGIIDAERAASATLLKEAFDALESMPLCAMGHAVETRRKIRAALAATEPRPEPFPLDNFSGVIPASEEAHRG